MNEWKRVEDETPPSLEDFLVFTPEAAREIRLAQFDHGEWWSVPMGNPLGGVTHWQPLPEPPEVAA